MPRETDNEALEAEQQALIGQAIAETHEEIFKSAFDQDPDEADGDTSLEDPEEVPTDVIQDGDEEEGDAEEEEAGDEQEGEEEPEEPRQEARAPRGRPDPRWRDRRVAERERDAERAELNALRAEVAAMRQAQQQPPPRQEQQQPQGPPDLFVDPEARLAYERNQWAGEVNRVISEFNNKRINSSFDDVRDQVGDDAFGEAFQALYETGDRNLINEIVSGNNPGRALMRWHERNSVLSEMGSDPEAYIERRVQERLADPEYRAQYVNNMRGEARERGASAYDLPPSLNSASGGMSHRNASGRAPERSRASESDIFLSAFKD